MHDVGLRASAMSDNHVDMRKAATEIRLSASALNIHNTFINSINKQEDERLEKPMAQLYPMFHNGNAELTKGDGLVPDPSANVDGFGQSYNNHGGPLNVIA